MINIEKPASIISKQNLQPQNETYFITNREILAQKMYNNPRCTMATLVTLLISVIYVFTELSTTVFAGSANAGVLNAKQNLLPKVKTVAEIGDQCFLEGIFFTDDGKSLMESCGYWGRSKI